MKQHLSNNWKIYFLLLFVYIQINFENKVLAQIEHTGIIWVVPNRPDAFPVNGNWTGNSGLNLAFEDFHVIEYAFLDSLYIDAYEDKIPIYQIRIQEEYASMEYDFMYLLHVCYHNFFVKIAYPYFTQYVSNGELISTDNGYINIHIDDTIFQQSLRPRNEISSYNKRMNLILRKYDIKSYEYRPFVLHTTGDTLWRTISILCQYQDALPLYYDLLTIHDLFDDISITSFYAFNEIDFPCGQYTGITDEEEPSLTIFPNPAQDEITISGVKPESVTLYDIMGKMIVSKFDSESNKINIKKLPNGLYIIKIITSDGKVFINKILKQ